MIHLTVSNPQTPFQRFSITACGEVNFAIHKFYEFHRGGGKDLSSFHLLSFYKWAIREQIQQSYFCV